MERGTKPPWTPTQERIGSVVVKAMSKANTWVYRLTGGRVGGRFFGGAPVLLLTTTGRKSGEPRVAPLLYLEDGDRLVIVASKGGMSHHPLWYRNLVANPDVEVTLGTTTRRMTAHTASPEEKEAYWPRLTAMYPDYASYQARTTRDIPVVVLSPRT
jgi:deazaflavin-dependent oxidoreductase (nitroreductase family)